MYTSKCPHKWAGKSKESEPIYDCYTKKGELCDGGRVQVGCTRDTGDFRLVIADSNGQKFKNDGGSLDMPSVSGKWKGVEWRFFPHTATKFKRG